MVKPSNKAGIDETSRDPCGLSCAEISRFENGAQHALGCYRVFADVFAVPGQHAAEILRPRTINRRAEDDVAGMPSAQLLQLRWKTQKGIDLPLRKELHRPLLRVDDPPEVLLG